MAHARVDIGPGCKVTDSHGLCATVRSAIANIAKTVVPPTPELAAGVERTRGTPARDFEPVMTIADEMRNEKGSAGGALGRAIGTPAPQLTTDVDCA